MERSQGFWKIIGIDSLRLSQTQAGKFPTSYSLSKHIERNNKTAKPAHFTEAEAKKNN